MINELIIVNGVLVKEKQELIEDLKTKLEDVRAEKLKEIEIITSLDLAELKERYPNNIKTRYLSDDEVEALVSSKKFVISHVKEEFAKVYLQTQRAVEQLTNSISGKSGAVSGFGTPSLEESKERLKQAEERSSNLMWSNYLHHKTLTDVIRNPRFNKETRDSAHNYSDRLLAKVRAEFTGFYVKVALVAFFSLLPVILGKFFAKVLRFTFDRLGYLVGGPRLKYKLTDPFNNYLYRHENDSVYTTLVEYVTGQFKLLEDGNVKAR